MRPRSERANCPTIAVLVDYDGTVVTRDISDEIVRRSAPETWRTLDSAYRDGDIGSRALLEAETRLLPSDRAEMADFLAASPSTRDFVRLWNSRAPKASRSRS